MDPVTIALAAAAASTLFKGITGFFSGRREASYLRNEATAKRREAGIGANIALEEGDRVAAQGAVQAAASGGGITGSAVNVLDDVARQSMFNARSTIYRGERVARDLNHQSSVAKVKANIGLIQSGIDAGASFLTGSANAALAKSGAAAGATAPKVDPLMAAGAY